MCFFFDSSTFSSWNLTISDIVSPSPLSGKNESKRCRNWGSVDIAENISYLKKLRLSCRDTQRVGHLPNRPPIFKPDNSTSKTCWTLVHKCYISHKIYHNITYNMYPMLSKDNYIPLNTILIVHLHLHTGIWINMFQLHEHRALNTFKHLYILNINTYVET